MVSRRLSFREVFFLQYFLAASPPISPREKQKQDKRVASVFIDSVKSFCLLLFPLRTHDEMGRSLGERLLPFQFSYLHFSFFFLLCLPFALFFLHPTSLRLLHAAPPPPHSSPPLPTNPALGFVVHYVLLEQSNLRRQPGAPLPSL